MNNAKRMRQLEKMFPDERVLCVSDDGLTVGLLNLQSGDVRVHCFNADEPNVVLENRFCDANTKLCMVLENGSELNADLGKVFSEVQNRLNELNSKLESSQNDLEKANGTIADMQKAETERRRSEAKSSVHKALEEINAMQESKDEPVVDEKVCEDVEKAIDEGEYDDCTNAKGEWCGAEKACAAIKALCMDFIRKACEAAAAKKRHVNAWVALGGDKNSTNPFDHLK